MSEPTHNSDTLPGSPENGEPRSSAEGDFGMTDSERGRSSIRGLLALFLVAAVVYLGMKLVPVYAAAYSLSDALRDEVVFASQRARRETDEEIRDRLLDRARELGLPLEEDDVAVRRSGPGRGTRIEIEADYTVPVEFVGGFVFRWRFTPHHEGPIIN